MNIKFSPPDITQAEIDAVTEVLKSGWITTGTKTKEFEKRISAYCNTPKTVCLNSATACLEMALRVLGIGKGDEVITSAYTYTASASVINHVGAKIVLSDTLKDSYEMDYNNLANLINENTKAIIPIDIAGRPCDYDKITAIINSKKGCFKPKNNIQKAMGRVALIADAAHSFGSVYKGTRAGGIADFTAFSFHAVKNLTTAEGGAITWRKIDGIDNDALYKEFMLWSLHGQNKDALSKTQLGNYEYDIERLGYKCNMTDIMAAIGFVQLDRFKMLLERREELISRYNKVFKDTNFDILNHYENHYLSSAHLYLIRIQGLDCVMRDSVISQLANCGIAANVHYKPLPMHTAYKNLGFNIKDYPNSFNQYKNEITLPLHTLLTNDEVDYIASNLIRIIRSINK